MAFIKRTLIIHVGYHCSVGYKAPESFGDSNRNPIFDVPKIKMWQCLTSVFEVLVLQPKSCWDSALAGAQAPLSHSNFCEEKQPRALVKCFCQYYFYRWRKKNLLKMRGKSGGAGDKAKLQLLQAEFVRKGVCDPEIKKNKKPFFLWTEELHESQWTSKIIVLFLAAVAPEALADEWEIIFWPSRVSCSVESILMIKRHITLPAVERLRQQP